MVIIKNSYPWPPKELNPNSRLFWRAKNPVKRAYRDQGYYGTKVVTLTEAQQDEPIACLITYHPPDKRHRDIDNLLAACKPLIDGMSDRLGINDRNIRPVTIDFGDVEQGGRVDIELNFGLSDWPRYSNINYRLTD